jgi:hypothetical protein
MATITWTYIGIDGPILESDKTDIEGTWNYIGIAEPIQGVETGGTPPSTDIAPLAYHHIHQLARNG